VAQPPFTVLVVCTGNICRSAFAERLGRAYLDDRLGNDARAVRIVSAGMRAVVDSAMHPDSALVLGDHGAEAGDFRARQFADHMADEADLILTMSRRHRQEVLERAPRALRRTFTLREASDLLRILEDDVAPDGPTFTHRARGLVARMAAARNRRQGSADDDVRDPIGQPLEVHAEAGEAIAEALFAVLRRLVDLGDIRASGPEPLEPATNDVP
jgi:protein-tyrosine phosphatase